MKTLFFKKWTYVVALIGLSLLFSGGLFAQTTPQYIYVSGIATPSAANGIYVKQSGTTGSLGWAYWKHESQNY